MLNHSNLSIIPNVQNFIHFKNHVLPKIIKDFPILTSLPYLPQIMFTNPCHMAHDNITPKLVKLGTWNWEKMFTSLFLTCHVYILTSYLPALTERDVTQLPPHIWIHGVAPHPWLPIWVSAQISLQILVYMSMRSVWTPGLAFDAGFGPAGQASVVRAPGGGILATCRGTLLTRVTVGGGRPRLKVVTLSSIFLFFP